MAYVANDQENEQNQQGTGAVSPSAPGGVQLSPNSGIGGAGTAAAGTNPTAAAPNAGGSFGSLNQYVAANQGQAQNLANQVTAPINQQYQTLQNQNASTLGGIQGQVNQGYTPEDTGLLAQEAANPVSFANNSSNVASFQKQLNDQYTGPQSAEGTTNFQNQQAAVNNAISTGQTETQTPAGQSQLLQNVEQNPNQSVTSLNQAILSNNPGAQSQVTNAFNNFGNLSTQLTNGANAIDTSIANNTANAQAANSQANQQLNNQFNGLNTAVNNQLNTANTTNSNYVTNYNNLVNDLATPSGLANITPDLESQLGLTADQIAALQTATNQANTSVFKSDPNFGNWSQASAINNDQFLTQGNTPSVVNANQVATPQQFQDLQALLALNGGNNTSVLNPADASEAGSYVAPTLNGAFNYQNALANAQNTTQQEQQAAQALSDQEYNTALAQHNAGSKSFFGGLANDIITHPLNLLTVPLNPVGYAQNAVNVINGKPVNAEALSTPYAQTLSPVVGGVLGGIYGGPAGAVGGSSAGSAIGKYAQNAPNLAFGGIVDTLHKKLEKVGN